MPLLSQVPGRETSPPVALVIVFVLIIGAAFVVFLRNR